MKSESMKVWDKTAADIRTIAAEQDWKHPVIVDKGIQLLKEKLGMK